MATEFKVAEGVRLGKVLYTDIEPDTGFYVAEDYHQKYYLRHRHEVVDTLYEIYPDPADFRDSTAAARLNGYLGGFGDLDNLMQNLDSLGLSEPGKQELIRLTKSGLTAACPISS